MGCYRWCTVKVLSISKDVDSTTTLGNLYKILDIFTEAPPQVLVSGLGGIKTVATASYPWIIGYHKGETGSTLFNVLKDIFKCISPMRHLFSRLNCPRSPNLSWQMLHVLNHLCGPWLKSIHYDRAFLQLEAQDSRCISPVLSRGEGLPASACWPCFACCTLGGCWPALLQGCILG